jgi:hypothetical protein
MVSRIRIVLLVNSIIAINWVLSKLTLVLAHESITKLNMNAEDLHIKIYDERCYLDDCFDEEGNGRASLSMWQHRIRAED